MPLLEGRLKKEDVLKTLMNMDFNYMCSVTITSKQRDWRDNDSIYRTTKAFLEKHCKRWAYFLIPAYQECMVLHFHGVFVYKYKNGKGFQTNRKILQTRINEFLGWSKVKHIRSTCKGKTVDCYKELSQIINYQWSEDNYAGCLEYPPMNKLSAVKQ